MDRQLLERLTGAAVLVVGLVILAPAILNGPAEESGKPEAAATAGNGAAAEPRRIHTIRLDAEQDSPPVARQVAPPPAPANSAGQTAATEQPLSAKAEPERPPAASQSPPQSKPAPAKPVSKLPPPATARKTVAINPAAAKTSGWVVQLGSFSSQENARQLADNVSQKGFPAFMMAVDRSGKKLYRVRVGPSETRPQADELAARLNKAGFAGQVTQQ